MTAGNPNIQARINVVRRKPTRQASFWGVKERLVIFIFRLVVQSVYDRLQFQPLLNQIHGVFLLPLHGLQL
ncbi:MAG: hypothetical protein UZ14_CFX002002585 [Chloroflexi bacterium OLB14]|nr:MAG: hypothetical protein UZ14_CFX002002585 [Chloroflexi bacterium OLB14]